MLYSAAPIVLLVKTKQYHHQQMDTLDTAPAPVPDTTEYEMFLCLVIITQVRHDP
jgi:hypothetical protein